MLDKIGQRVTKLRERKNLNLTQLAKRSHCNPATIHEIENNKSKNLSLITVINIAKALDVTIDFLVYGEESLKMQDSDPSFFRKYESLSHDTKGALKNLLESMDNEK